MHQHHVLFVRPTPCSHTSLVFNQRALLPVPVPLSFYIYIYIYSRCILLFEFAIVITLERINFSVIGSFLDSSRMAFRSSIMMRKFSLVIWSDPPLANRPIAVGVSSLKFCFNTLSRYLRV